MFFLAKIRLFIQKHSKALLWLFILLYGLFLAYLSIIKLHYFLYNNFDLSIFSQVFFNTLNGHWFDMTINLHNYLADHSTPIIILLLPIYALKPSPDILLVIQSFVLALAAWPLYLIAYRVSVSRLLALGVSLAWLLNPFVHYANLFEFHLLTILPFLFFWLFYFYQQNKFKIFLLFFILALLVREDISLLLLGFSLLAFLDKKNWQWKYLITIISLLYFFIAIKIIGTFSLNGSYKFFAYYNWLGGHDIITIFWSFISHPIKVLLHIFSLQNTTSILIVLWPFLFLPILKPKYLLLSAISFLATLLTVTSFDPIIFYTHYSLFILPSIFISFIFSLQHLKNYKYKNFIFLLLMVTIIYLAIFLSPVKNLLTYSPDKQGVAYRQEVLEQIGDQATIAASASFLADLSNREIVYPISYSYFGGGQFLIEDFDLPLVDYILIDYKNFFVDIEATNASFFSNQIKETMNDKWRKRLSSYVLIWAKDDILLFKNKDQVQGSLTFVDILEKERSAVNENEKLILDSKFTSKDNSLALKINYDLLRENYLIRFYGENGYYFDLPLVYSLFSEKTKLKNKMINVKYYLNSDIKNYQIFLWQADNLLGPVGEAISDFKLESITDKIYLK